VVHSAATGVIIRNPVSAEGDGMGDITWLFSHPIKATRRPVSSAPLIDGMGLSEGRGFGSAFVVAHRG